MAQAAGLADTAALMALMEKAARLRGFYQALAVEEPYAVLLEGMPPLPGTVGEQCRVNKSAYIGLVPAQVMMLHQGVLWQEAFPTRISTPIAEPDALWQVLNTIKTGRWAVLLGYGFSRYCDPGLWQAMAAYPTMENTLATPDLLLVRFEDWLTLDWQSGHLTVESPDTARADRYRQCWAHQPDAPSIDTVPTPPLLDAYANAFDKSFNAQSFGQAVETVKTAIVQGELYQANLTLRLSKAMQLDPWAVYGALSTCNPSPFAGMMHWPACGTVPAGTLLSNSPERLVALDSAGTVSMRPIAGTRGRGTTLQEDEAIGQTLLNDAKERAEHLMLVDLARNDVGRVAVPATVAVDELLSLERYSHVTHLVSNVVGRLAPDHGLWDVVRATFPGGTITGCPKIRCVQVLSPLEPVARGLYTGALGWMDFAQGTMDLNILIRSLALQATATPLVYNGALHVGAGIVADSVAAHEYRECFRKAAAILGVLSRYDQHCCQ